MGIWAVGLWGCYGCCGVCCAVVRACGVTRRHLPGKHARVVAWPPAWLWDPEFARSSAAPSWHIAECDTHARPGGNCARAERRLPRRRKDASSVRRRRDSRRSTHRHPLSTADTPATVARPAPRATFFPGVICAVPETCLLPALSRACRRAKKPAKGDENFRARRLSVSDIDTSEFEKAQQGTPQAAGARNS